MRLIDVRKVWDRAPHNAFTDLIRFGGRWYCSLREATEHLSEDGKARVLTSGDGWRWESAALLQADGDIRDPKLCITPDGRLMLLVGTAFYRRQPGHNYEGRNPLQSLVWFSRGGRDWGAPIEVGELNWWLWRVTWHKGSAYGVGREDVQMPRLYRSTDGVQFDIWVESLFEAYPEFRGNEASLLFLPDDSALCLIRGATLDAAFVGQAGPPYLEWRWQRLPENIGGPQLIQLPDGRVVAGGRRYGDKREMQLWWLDAEHGRLDPALTLPSGGDTSYPGMVFHEGVLWVSYYSSHEEKTAIYLARVDVCTEG